MDVLTGAGEIVTAAPDGEHADLFAAFPNSYGTLGYATRLRIELAAGAPHVALRHVRLRRPGLLATAIAADRCRTAARTARPVDFVDGVVFEPGRDLPDARPLELTRRRQPQRLHRPGRSTTARCAERSHRRAHRARLPVALGHRLVLVLGGVRRAAPRACGGCGRARCRRSDVYHRLVGLENRYRVAARIDRLAGPARARARRAGRRDPGRAAGRLPALVRRRGRDAAGLAVPAAAARAGGPGSASLAAVPARARA